MPIKLGKSYIPQKNTLLSIVWKNFWNCKNFCHGRLQTSFSKSNAFSVKGACPPPGWCHAHFFHEWSSPLLVLSIDVSFVLKFFWKGDKNLRNWTNGPIHMEDPVMVHVSDSLKPYKPQILLKHNTHLSIQKSNIFYDASQVLKRNIALPAERPPALSGSSSGWVPWYSFFELW